MQDQRGAPSSKNNSIIACILNHEIRRLCDARYLTRNCNNPAGHALLSPLKY